MKTAQDVIRAAKEHGTDSLQFHIAVEEMALQRDILRRALERMFLACSESPGSVPVPVMQDAESALSFAEK